jgi:hypothetical protein
VSYNLLEEDWIPVLRKDGTPTRVGIKEALAQAGEIRQIAASNPMDRVAILRFLLALLYWCRGNPPDDKDSISSFPAQWFNKLDDNRDCFNLLGEGKRFYQCKTQSGKEEKLTANYLMQEVPSGTNSWHFRHSTDKRDGLCPACCAAGLLRLPLFATSGGRGKPPGVNQKPPIYVIPRGVSLLETLHLSYRKVPDTELGTPFWANPNQALPKHGKVPLLLGLTWVPRRVWLDAPQEPEANCMGCGRREFLIRQCVFAGVGSTKTEEGGGGRAWNDPHAVVVGDELLKPRNALGAADAASDQWAGIAAGILAGNKAYASGIFWVVSFATVQNDKYLEASECEISIPGTVNDQQAQHNNDPMEMWRKEGWKLASKARPKGTTRKHLEIPPMLAAIRPDVEAKVSENVGELASGCGDAWDRAAREYTPMMAAVARSLSPGYTTAALRRRRVIANLKPDMRPRTPAGGKAKRKKGGTDDSNGTVRQSPDRDEIW